MNTNIVLTLDTRRQKKDGTFPIKLHLSHYRKSVPISTGYAVKKSDWNDKLREVKNSYKGTISVGRLNNLLADKKKNAKGVITQLDEADLLRSLSIAKVKEKILEVIDINKTKNVNHLDSDFVAYFEKRIMRLKQAKKIGNATANKDALSFLLRYAGQKDIAFSDIDYKLLLKLETAHLARGRKLNGLAAYMRAIRATFNQGLKEYPHLNVINPFDSYKIKTEDTSKRAIGKDHIKKILELDLPSDHTCYYARNYFLASYMMFGMSFIDMAFMRVKNMVDGRIKYQRAKTSTAYSIKITDSLDQILAPYLKGKNPEDFVFPIIKHDHLTEQRKDVRAARDLYNKHLKKLADLCGIEEKITSYVSRHSFASNADSLGIPVTAIKQMLGHKSLKTTQIYLASLNDSALDEYNEEILKL